MKKICVISASTGKNLELAHSIIEQLKKHQAEATLINIVELQLPLYSAQAETQFKAEELIAPFKHQLDVDAFIIVAPEYNGGPPPVFSNFLSWVSRSTKNWRETFNKKTGMIATASGGGGTNVLMLLRMQLSFIGMTIIGRQIISTFNKPVGNEEIEKVVLELLEAIPGKL